MSKRLDTRAAICALFDAGNSVTAIAKALKTSRPTIYRTLNKRASTGTIQHAAGPRKKAVLTPRVAAGLRRRIKAAPTKSLTRVAEEAGLGPRTVQRFVVDQGWRSLRRKKVPLISKTGRLKRQKRAKILLNKLKESGYPGRIVFFSDDKNFVVDPVYNPQNDRYIDFYEDSDEDSEDEEGDRPRARPCFIARSKHPASAMFFGAVASTGEVSPPHLVPYWI